MASPLPSLLEAAQHAFDLSEVAAKAAEDASKAAALVRVQAKKALDTVMKLQKVQLSIDTEMKIQPKKAKDASTSTEDLSWIEMAKEATEYFILEQENDSLVTSSNQNIYTHIDRDLLLSLQHHPIALQYPHNVSDHSIIMKSVNKDAFHASPGLLPFQKAKNYVIPGRPAFDVTSLLDINFKTRNLLKRRTISLSQTFGVLMLIKEYEGILSKLTSHLGPEDQKTVQQALADMEVVRRPRKGQFKSDCVPSGFISRVLGLCSNAGEKEIKRGELVPEIGPGRMSVSKGGNRVTFQRVTVQALHDDNGMTVAVCWKSNLESANLCYLALAENVTITRKLLKQSRPVCCNLQLTVDEDGGQLTANLAPASTVFPSLEMHSFLNQDEVCHHRSHKDNLITRIILSLCLHQLANVYSGLSQEIQDTSEKTILLKFFKLLEANSVLISFVRDTYLNDVSPMTVEQLLRSSENVSLLDVQLSVPQTNNFAQVTVNTDNTIQIKDVLADVNYHSDSATLAAVYSLTSELTEEAPRRYQAVCHVPKIQDSSFASTCHITATVQWENTVQKVSVSLDGFPSQDNRTSSSERLTFYDERSSGVAFNTNDETEYEHEHFMSTPGDIVTVDQEPNEQDAHISLLESQELVKITRFPMVQDSIIQSYTEKEKHQILFKVSSENNSNVTMHGVTLYVREQISQVIVTVSQKTAGGSFGVVLTSNFSDVTSFESDSVDLFFAKPLELLDQFYLLTASLTGGSSLLGTDGVSQIKVQGKNASGLTKLATVKFETYPGKQGKKVTNVEEGQIPGMILSVG